MKSAKTIFSGKRALALCVAALIGLLPLAAAGAQAPVTASGLAVSAAKGSDGVSATLSNASSEAVGASVIFAAYGPNGKLGAVERRALTVGAGASAEQNFEYDFAANPDGVVKLYVWDSGSLRPLLKETTSARCVTIDGSGVAYDGINVVGGADAAEFLFVRIDEFTKRGEAVAAAKLDGDWTFAGSEGMDVVIAYRPAQLIGAALPDAELTELRAPNGKNTARAVVSQ